MNNHQKFMLKAIQKAKQGVKKGQTPFGACIVKNNKIEACEHNVVWKTTDITAHAEIYAIRKACKKLKTINLESCTIYSTTEPCPMCFSAIHWARISTIVYGTKIKDVNRFGFNELQISNNKLKRQGKSKIKIVKNMLRKENLKLLEFWSKRNPKTY